MFTEISDRALFSQIFQRTWDALARNWYTVPKPKAVAFIGQAAFPYGPGGRRDVAVYFHDCIFELSLEPKLADKIQDSPLILIILVRRIDEEWAIAVAEQYQIEPYSRLGPNGGNVYTQLFFWITEDGQAFKGIRKPFSNERRADFLVPIEPGDIELLDFIISGQEKANEAHGKFPNPRMR